MNNAKIGTALVGGYVLGRTKKVKLALGLGALLAGSRIKPGQVGKALQQSPFVHTLTDQVRSELTGAGKAAATTLLSSKADHLADSLHQRTAGLRGEVEEPGEQDTGRDEDAEDETEPEDEYEDEDEEETEPEDEEETEPDEEPREEKAEAPRKAPRSGGRAKTQRGKSGQDAKQDSEQEEKQPRKRKTAASQSRSRSGGTARSRRQDDG